MYLIDRIIYFDNLFNDYFIKNNTNDQVSQEEIINNSTLIETPDWVKNKKCTINPQNSDNNGFQYSVTLSLYHEQITGKNLFRVSNIKPFVDNINRKNINFPPQEQNNKTLEMNNK